MKKIFTLVILSALCATVAKARQLSPEEALGAVMRTPSATRMLKSRPGEIDRARLVYTSETAGRKLLYVFDRGVSGGYLVVSADDVARPLLGYADSGTFNPDSMPSAMEWWLRGYADEIGYMIAHDASPSTQTSTGGADTRQSVSPIVKTEWNQDAPFNDLCPVLDGDERAVTGCVATAMAQVMKVHQWPVTGVGSNSYSFTYGSTSHDVSVDFGSTTYQWDEMLDVYDDTSSASACEAVATLMYSCGAAVDMHYSFAKDGGSGAASLMAAVGLVKFFNYDKGVRYLSRENYDLDTWCDMLYDEVSAGRPVLYGGRSDEGGHEFVCDGYSSDGYFHINWGWGGVSNGYFLISALDPGSQGIGGSGSGYNADQDMIVGIQPPVTGSVVVPQMVLSGDFLTPYQQCTIGDGAEVEFLSQNGTFYSTTVEPISATLGVKLTREDGSVSYIGSSSVMTFDPGYGTHGYVLAASDFPIGSYRVTPAFSVDGVWHDVSTGISFNNGFDATCDGSTITFAVPTSPVALTVTQYKLNSPIYPDSYCCLAAEIKNNGPEFYGTVVPALVTGNTIVAEGTADPLSLAEGDSVEMSWVTKFTGSQTLTAGDYDLVFLTSDGYTVGGPYSVTVDSVPAGDAAVTLVSVAFVNNPGRGGSSDDPAIVGLSDNLSVQVELKCTGGYWADVVKGAIADMDGAIVGYVGDEFVGLKSGESRVITLSGSMSAYDAGQEYMFVPWAEHFGQLGGVTFVKLSDTTFADSMEQPDGIMVYPNPAVSAVTVSSPDEISSISVYNLTGIPALTVGGEGCGSVSVYVDSLTPGMYIMRISTASGIRVRHLVKQ
ncbi:MAG: thiol protease/hemagglutinin PrtT [Pseudoflavonifractor sp.]|nr:thiol protease/hemagglutinin PrtT [Pseudoflavonifractor sp.]